jgi:eukaryotic-like serine/threonine-protein kinase
VTTETQDPFVKGQRIDRYEIREHIGQGGMGAVYRAVDTKLGRTVALKTVVAHRRGDRLTEEIRERFMREALAASRVDHRNVVQVLDFGFADDGTPYMVMEYLRGRSLNELVKKTTEPLAIDYVADVMLSVCAALRACHHVGIIHRDLKPANIFLCDTDTGWEVKVLDFGISKAPATEDLTEDGQIIGTPQYLSPEQIEGTVGPESDQYALGVLMYMCLSQRLPYAGYQSMRLFRAIAEGKFDPPRKLRPDIPEGLEAIVLRAMHLSPKARFESIHALGQRLWEFASPSGQTQWKTFYFHTPAAPQSAHKTETSKPNLRALVRESVPLAAPASPDAGSAAESRGSRIESTASLPPASALAKTEPLHPPTAGPSAAAITKTAAAAGVGEATSLSHSDIAGESALSDARDTFSRMRARRVARWRVALALAGVAGVTFFVQRAWRANHPAARASAGVIVGPPAAAAPGPAAATPATAAVAAPSQPATPPPAPAATTTAAPAAKEDTPPKEEPPPRASRKKHATHRSKAPKMDQHGIGIPSD